MLVDETKTALSWYERNSIFFLGISKKNIRQGLGNKDRERNHFDFYHFLKKPQCG